MWREEVEQVWQQLWGEVILEIKEWRLQHPKARFKPESTEGRPWGQPLKKPAGAPLNLG